ncbi:mechanosensitive ion channel family protein [Arundinibacter roseus]|uniref:Mechanosensitive ion channel n=1 Tax=Arundinibacter roseus TaxID=2070510 RepID=A0A4V2XAE2_9BACT|nr:mechanosensitive ion channel domain-containing protein [Arundinibacter roseus]TDB67075.1 mechanosensitive ion channel [Arundinibacter roseus]
MEFSYWYILVLAVVLGIFTAWSLIRIIHFLSKKPDRTFLKTVNQNITNVIYFFFPVLFLTISSTNPLSHELKMPLFFPLSKLALLTVSTWLVIRIVVIFEKFVLAQLDLNKANNNEERKLFTKVKFIKRIIIICIFIISFSLLLLSFEKGREFGLGLLTSAGIVSVIVGFAAQKTIGNLLAGIQIAFTQPLKIEDVVIVEGEWGRIEEINLTYIVVKTWDFRRLVLPITYFIEKPFQNWTRNDSSLIGSAFFYLDFHAPIEKIRTNFLELLKNNPLWDGNVAAFQVTDTKDQYMVVRAIMSARNAGDAFDLRCEVREQIIRLLTTEFPEALPRVPLAFPQGDTPGAGTFLSSKNVD